MDPPQPRTRRTHPTAVDLHIIKESPDTLPPGPLTVEISVVFITLNEEENLPRVLEKLRWCEEVVVVDSGSTDRTLEIAHRFGAHVVHRDFDGFASQKNFADQQASNDWILSLDADEVPSDDLSASLRRIKAGGVDHDAYRCPRKAYYLGKWIHHSGWYPDKKVRLYDRRKARWEGLVHESVQVNGTIGELDGDLLHYTCPSLSDHIRTTDRYTTLAAQQYRAEGRQPRIGNLLLSPPWAFVRSYFLKLGFLDGVEGLIIASMAAFYVFAKYAKARQPQAGKPKAA